MPIKFIKNLSLLSKKRDKERNQNFLFLQNRNHNLENIIQLSQQPNRTRNSFTSQERLIREVNSSKSKHLKQVVPHKRMKSTNSIRTKRIIINQILIQTITPTNFKFKF